jgi:DNA-binding LacI/PurR family transcriptional regulator
LNSSARLAQARLMNHGAWVGKKLPIFTLPPLAWASFSACWANSAIDDLCEHQVDGLVLGVRVEGSTDIHKLCRGIPFVALDPSAALKVPTVIVDQQYGTRLAIQYLVDSGHKQIACIGGPPRWSASKERRKGWTTALKQAGLEPGRRRLERRERVQSRSPVAGTRPKKFHRHRGG